MKIMTIILRTKFSNLIGLFLILSFAVNAVAQDTLPASTELLHRAKSKPYPRSIDAVALKSEIDWGGRWVHAHNKVSQQYLEPLAAEPLLGTPLPMVQKITFAEVDKTLLAAAIWLRTGNPNAAAEAKRRALNIASWSPAGATGFVSHDQSGIAVAKALALAHDWLYEQWTPAERALLLSSIRPRIVEVLSKDTLINPYGLDNGRQRDRKPFDSHAAINLSQAAMICSVLASNDPLYDQCTIDLLPRYLSNPIPWGVNDGGYSNGTNYAQWDVTFSHFMMWNLLNQIVGVDLWKTSWAKGFINFMAYFLPPGAPSGLFGDGAEQSWPGVWATQGKAYVGYLPSPLSNWYARNQSGEEKHQLTLLLSPQRDMRLIPTALPRGTAHGIHIPSIGWVAMHSDLGDRSRTSVYFKSSPYGSFNHSHADQNSFVIHSMGQVLAVDSGYYDFYNSSHWVGWAKTTRAHNAITFDGGQGQLHNTLTAKGIITQFTSTPGYDLVSGNASEAYGGILTKAVRSMVYLRPNILLVFDSLSSNVARTWEWNIHTLAPMIIKGARNIEINQGGVRLCVRQIVGPDVAFDQTDKFTADPVGAYPKQSHGTFSSTAKSMTAVFVTVLEVGCGNVPLMISGTGENRDVTMLGITFGFNGESVLKK